MIIKDATRFGLHSTGFFLGLTLAFLPLGASRTLAADELSAPSDDFAWIKSYKGQYFDQTLSPRFQNFLSRELPSKWPDLGYTKKTSKPTLEDVTRSVLAGPTEPMTGRDSRAYFWACMAHACAHKGFVWVDAATKKTVLSVVHYSLAGKTFKKPQLLVATKGDACKELPKNAKGDVKIWLANVKVKPEVVRCLDASGEVQKLKL